MIVSLSVEKNKFTASKLVNNSHRVERFTYAWHDATVTLRFTLINGLQNTPKPTPKLIPAVPVPVYVVPVPDPYSTPYP